MPGDQGVLHEDDPRGTGPTGPDRPAFFVGFVYNLTAEEYAATYADGEPHPEPPPLEELRAALADDVAADYAHGRNAIGQHGQASQ